MTTLADTQTELCPLPRGFYWEVELIPRLNTVHLNLCKRWSLSEETGKCVVLDALHKSVDSWVRELVPASHKIWSEYTVKTKNDKKVWRDKANQIQTALGSNTVVKVR